jgi:hypothetical protein
MTKGRGFSTILGISLILANSAFGQSNACDLDASGGVNVVDVNRAVSMALGTTPCTADVEAQNTCTIVTVQRVVNNALGQPCVTFNATTHTVALLWLPSPTIGVVGYNVYRRTTPSGTPVKLNSVVNLLTTFVDTTIQSGQSYYYSATAVGLNGMESAESAQAPAAIPLF